MRTAPSASCPAGEEAGGKERVEEVAPPSLLSPSCATRSLAGRAVAAASTAASGTMRITAELKESNFASSDCSRSPMACRALLLLSVETSRTFVPQTYARLERIRRGTSRGTRRVRAEAASTTLSLGAACAREQCKEERRKTRDCNTLCGTGSVRSSAASSFLFQCRPVSSTAPRTLDSVSIPSPVPFACSSPSRERSILTGDRANERKIDALCSHARKYQLHRQFLLCMLLCSLKLLLAHSALDRLDSSTERQRPSCMRRASRRRKRDDASAPSSAPSRSNCSCLCTCPGPREPTRAHTFRNEDSRLHQGACTCAHLTQ